MAMAHDVPVNNVNGWGAISLPEYLEFNRTGRGWGKDITCWHVTNRSNLGSIAEQGLKASTCTKWMSGGRERPEAVYLFCSQSVVASNLPVLFEESSDVVVLTVTIPSSHLENVRGDDSYNIGFESSMMSAIQYRGSIPREWIEDIGLRVVGAVEDEKTKKEELCT